MNRLNLLLSPILLLFLLFLFVHGNSGADYNTAFSDDDERKACEERLSSFDVSLKDKPIDEVITEVGISFLGTEYVAGTLDENPDEEVLVIKISGLDCVTFVENVLAMSRLVKKGKIDIEDYENELESIRYRDGNNTGYTSRLHYFTDWIYDNEGKGVIKDITYDIGGVPYNKNINFMTTHTKSYKQLHGNNKNISRMKDVESAMNERELFYIPKSKVNYYYDLLQTGDIIATTTDIGGLDVTHTGFIFKENGKTYFMHASSTENEVVISYEQLKQYLQSNKKQTGIIVARPLDVNE
ncbi:N-acetylmuramoyl-L-alanine amidase-like domain-containing protein [Bacteroidota bacterium]